MHSRLWCLMSVLSVSIVLEACGLKGSSLDGGNAPGTVIDVAGFVRSGVRYPILGAKIMIVGKGSSVTDWNGRFSFSSVQVPYDLVLFVPANPETMIPEIVVYVGLTRANPTLEIAGGPFLSKTDIYGKLTGVNHTLEAERTVVAFSSEEVVAAGTYSTTNVDNFLDTFSWVGPKAVTGTIHALNWGYRAGSSQAVFQGYGKATNVVVTDGVDSFVKDIALSPVSTGLLTGTVLLPPMFELYQQSVSLQFDTKAARILIADDLNGATFSYSAPVISGATLSVSALASGTGAAAERSSRFERAGLSANEPNLTLPLPTPPALEAPVPAQANVILATQRFSWGAMSPAGIYAVLFSTTRAKFSVFTAATNIVLPKFVDLGLEPLDFGAPVAWSVTGIGGQGTTVDEYTAASRPLISSTDSWSGSSERREATVGK